MISARLHMSSGFSLIELLIVVGIVAVLTALAIPGISFVQEKSAVLKCSSNVRQWDQAFLIYASENGGMLPTYNPTTSAWQDNLAPYLVHLEGYYLSYPRFALRTQLHCPKNSNIGWAYGTNRNLLPTYNTSAPRMLSGLLQPSTLLIISETDNDGVTTMEADAIKGVNYSRHKTGSNVGFADGHVEFLSRENALKQVSIPLN